VSLLDLLNPVKDIANVVNGIIGKFVVDPTEKAQLQAQLAQAQDALVSKAMDLQGQLTEAQSKIIVAEAQSESWLPRNIRPLCLLTLLVIIVYQGIFVSAFSLPAVSFTAIPTQLWTLFTVGFGGYVVGRSAEKSIANWKPNGNGNTN
jgi:hypothetical protein